MTKPAPTTFKGKLTSYDRRITRLERRMVRAGSGSGGDGVIPAGAIMAWGSDAAPANWVMAHGQALSRQDHASLFAAYGTRYGAGDGSTTFNVPDFRGRSPIGWDPTQVEFDTLGEAFGAKNHTLTVAEMPAHSHNPPVAIIYNGNASAERRIFTTNSPPWSGGDSYNAVTSTGGGGAHNNTHPVRVVNFIIKTSNGDTPGDSQLTQRVSALEQGTALARLARGKVAMVTRPNNFATALASLVDVAQMSMTFTAEAGRQYRAKFTGPSVSSGTAGDRAVFAILVNGVMTGVMYQDANSLGHPLNFEIPFVASGTTTVKLQMGRDIGSGTLTQLGFSYGPAVGLIEDIGLA